MWNCKNCGKDNPDDRENCWSCGRNREQSEKIITGTEIVEKQSVPSSQNDSHPPAQVEMPVTEKQGGGLMNNKTRKGERSRGRTSLLGKIISGISAVVTLIAYFFLPWQQGQTGNMRMHPIPVFPYICHLSRSQTMLMGTQMQFLPEQSPRPTGRLQGPVLE